MTSPNNPSRWPTIGLAVAAGVIAAMQVGKVPPSLPLISEELELSRVTAGLIASLFFVAGALLAVVMGTMTDRFGERRLLFFGLTLLATGSLIGGLIPDSGVLLATRVVEGLGYTSVVVTAPKIIAATAGRKDTVLALGIWSCFMPTGMALMMLISPALMGAMGWQGLWLFNAATLAVFAGILALGLHHSPWQAKRRNSQPDNSPAPNPFDWSGARRLMACPGPWLFALCFTLYTIQWFAIMAWLPTFLIESQGRGLAGASMLAALVVFSNVFGNLAAGWTMHRGVPRWALISTAFIAMGTTGALIFSSGVVGTEAKVPLAIIFSALGGLLPASCIAGVVVHSPSPAQNAMANGFVIQGSAIGSLIGAPVLGALSTSYGNWENFWWVMLIAPVIGIGVAALLRGPEQQLSD